MRAWQKGLVFKELVAKDRKITKLVPEARLKKAFSVKRQLRNVDAIFNRVFGSTEASSKVKTRAAAQGKQRR
jgi:adenylosuccinate lyase